MSRIHDAKIAQMSVGYTSEGGRKAADFYETPSEAVHALLGVEAFSNPIWEPACGRGAIVKVLEEHAYDVVASDLYEYETDIDAEFGIDFLKTTYPLARDIITNPPFSLATEFTYKAVEHIKITKGKVALLERLAWLESLKRKPMFESTPLARVWVFSRRIPRMHRPDYNGRKCSSIIAFAWFVWDATHVGPPTLGWLDWKEHV